tara:strand:- start:616 stop:1905 length:1290 start_codon:yes stop_codon:yes gene_type:complete
MLSIGSYLGHYPGGKTGMEFDGVYDEIYVPFANASGLLNKFTNTVDYSISLWFKPFDEGGNEQTLFGTRHKTVTNTYWNCKYNHSTKEIQFTHLYSGSTRGLVTTNADALDGCIGNWTHLLITHDTSEGTGDETSGAWKFYINGSLESSNTLTHNTNTAYDIDVNEIQASGIALRLGSYWSAGTQRGRSNMAQFAIWDGEVLNADDAAAIYAAGIEWDLRDASGNYNATDVSNLSVYYILDKYYGENRFYNGPSMEPTASYYYFKNLANTVDESEVFNSALTTGMGYASIPFPGGGATESVEDGFYTITGHQTNVACSGQIEVQDITSDSAPSGKDQMYEIDFDWSVTAGVYIIAAIFTGGGAWLSDGEVKNQKVACRAESGTGKLTSLVVVYISGHDASTKFKIKINSVKKLDGCWNNYQEIPAVNLY